MFPSPIFIFLSIINTPYRQTHGYTLTHNPTVVIGLAVPGYPSNILPGWIRGSCGKEINPFVMASWLYDNDLWQLWIKPIAVTRGSIRQ